MAGLRSRIGVTKGQAAQEERRMDELTIPLNEPGQYIIHPIGGLVRHTQRWIPVLRYNQQENKYEHSWQVVTGECPLLDEIEKADFLSRKRWHQMSAEREGRVMEDAKLNQLARSRMAPTTQYMILAFDMSNDPPVVKRLPLKWTAWKALRQLQEKPSIKKPGNLMFGPMYAFQCIITHERDDNSNKPEMYRHKYDVSIYEAPFKDELSADLLNQGISDELFEQCFTEEEREAIDACKIDLEAEVVPKTTDDIKELFSKTPLNLGAMDKEQFPIFIDPQSLIEKLDSYDLGYQLPGSAPDVPRKAITTVKKGTPQIQAPKKGYVIEPNEEVEDVEVEPEVESEVVEDDTAEEVPAGDGDYEETTDEVEQEADEPIESESEPQPDDDNCGWESTDELAVILDSFEPETTIQSKLYDKWVESGCLKDKFDKFFPGMADKILGKTESKPEGKPSAVKTKVVQPKVVQPKVVQSKDAVKTTQPAKTVKKTTARW